MGKMSRHTTFRYCLDLTAEQRDVLARHAGAARFAFNQCLLLVKSAPTQRRENSPTDFPWTGFDLINAFNAGQPMLADGMALTDTLRVSVKPTRMTREPTFSPLSRPVQTTPEKGGAKFSTEMFGTL